MAAGNWIPYGHAAEAIQNKEADIDTDALKAIFLRSTYTPSHDHDALADLTANEASNYTRPTVTPVALARTGATTTFDVQDISVTPSGGDMLAKYVAIYDDDHIDDLPLAYLDLNDGGGEITVPDGVEFTVIIAATGIWQSTAS